MQIGYARAGIPYFFIPNTAAARPNKPHAPFGHEAHLSRTSDKRLKNTKIRFPRKRPPQNITTYLFFAYLCPVNRTERNEITLNK